MAEDPLYAAARLLDSLGDIPESARLDRRRSCIVDDKLTMKCACDKVVKVMEMPRCHSGVVPFIDNICAGCEDQAKGLSPVICATCHRVCGRLIPETDSHGFKIEAGRTYHIQTCPLCEPDKFTAGDVKTPIIEMLLFHRKMGVQS